MNIRINGTEIEAFEGETILQAASRAGIKIPTLCHMEDIAPGGSCGVCEVEADGRPVRSCVFKVKKGMEIVTDTEAVRTARKERLLAMAERHRFDCEFCPRCMDCEFIRVLCENGIYDFEYQRRANADHRVRLAGNIVFDDTLCVGCRRCAAACTDGSVTIEKTEKGFICRVDADRFTGSGECVAACPTAAFSIDETDEIRAIRRATHDRTCHAIVSPDAAAVFGEMLFDAAGGDFAGKMAAILRKLGFKKVFLAGRKASVADISRAVKTDENIVTVSISTITGPVRPGADIDITIQTLITIFRRACVSRTTMIRVWRSTPAEDFDVVEGLGPAEDFDAAENSAAAADSDVAAELGISASDEAADADITYHFGGAMPHRDCYVRNMNDLAAAREAALERILG